MGCAMPTGKKFARQSRAAQAVSCTSQPWCVMPTTTRLMPDHESSQRWTSRNSSALSRTSTAARAAGPGRRRERASRAIEDGTVTKLTPENCSDDQQEDAEAEHNEARECCAEAETHRSGASAVVARAMVLSGGWS
jgi:hypothetical protein